MPHPDTRVLITGAASGIGAATVHLLVNQGCRVAACDINSEGLQSLRNRLGDRVVPFELDVRRADQWERVLGAVWTRFAGLDVHINNAGLVHIGLSHELPREKLQHMIDVNILGVVHGTCSVIPRFLKQGHGHIVNTASLASFIPTPGFALYSGTKHAIRAFSHGVALELRKTPVTVSIVCPAAVETPMLHQQVNDQHAELSFADPTIQAEDVARAIVRAVDEKPREILIPRGRGNVLRFVGLFPGLVARMLPGAERRGRRELARRRSAD